MHVRNLLRVAALTSLTILTSAFTVPSGTADGVYRVHIDEGGVEIHEIVSSLPHRDAAPEPSDPTNILLARTQYQTIYCGCGYNLDHGNCDDAVAALENNIGYEQGSVIPAGTGLYVRVGSVIAFVCNYGNAIGTQAQTLASNLQVVTALCGWYVAGTFRVTDTGGDDTAWGYMNWYDGLNFCTAAVGSALQTPYYGQTGPSLC
jgi:hypothetical protein